MIFSRLIKTKKIPWFLYIWYSNIFSIGYWYSNYYTFTELCDLFVRKIWLFYMWFSFSRVITKMQAAFFGIFYYRKNRWEWQNWFSKLCFDVKNTPRSGIPIRESNNNSRKLPRICYWKSVSSSIFEICTPISPNLYLDRIISVNFIKSATS